MKSQISSKGFIILLILCILGLLFPLVDDADDKYYIQDMRFPAMDFTKGAVNDPDLVTYKGFQAYSFPGNKYAELEVFFQYPHIEDGIITFKVIPHFHWTATSNLTTKQCIVWGEDHMCANIFGYYTTTITNKKQFCFTGNISNQHLYSIMNTIAVPQIENSRQCFVRIFRDALNASDNMTQGAILQEFDIHYFYRKYGEEIQ